MEAAVAAFVAILDGQDPSDFTELLAADAVVWHNNDGVDLPAGDSLAGIAMLRSLVDDLTAHVISEDVVPTGVVARIELRGTVKSSGNAFCARLADFFTVVDGRLTRIDEYVDPSIRVQLGL